MLLNVLKWHSNLRISQALSAVSVISCQIWFQGWFVQPFFKSRVNLLPLPCRLYKFIQK